MYNQIVLNRVFKPILISALFARLVIFCFEDHNSIVDSLMSIFNIIICGIFYDIIIAIFAANILLLILLVFDSKITRLFSYKYFFYKFSIFIWYFIIFANMFFEISYWYYLGDRYNLHLFSYKINLEYHDALSFNMFIIMLCSFALSVIFTKSSKVNNIRKNPILLLRLKSFVIYSICSVIAMTIIHFNNGSDYNSINQMMKNGIYNLIELSMSEKKTSDKFPYYYLSIDKKISNRIFEKQISSKNEEFISSDLNDISRWSHNNSFSPNLSSKNIIVITYDNLPYEMINLQNLNNSIKDFTDHSIIFKNHFTTHNNSDETIISSLISTFFLKDKTLNQGFEKSLLPAFIENKYNIQYFADKYLQVNGLSKVLDHFKIKYVDRGNVLKSLGIKQTKERVEKQMQKLWVNQADKLHDEQSKFMFLINSSIMKNISKNNSSLATSEIISTLESLKNKEWYENTIFIITASSSSLRNNSYKLLKNYHVPLIVYLPNSNLNEEFEIISSSQDLMPSILSLLNVDYLNKSPASNSFLKNNQVAHFTHGPVLGSIEKFKGDYLVKTLEPRKIGFEQIFNQEYMKIKHSKILNATDLISFYQSIYEN